VACICDNADMRADDFEVSIFLTDVRARHTLLTRHKQFHNKTPLKSNSTRLTGGGAGDDPVEILQEESEEERIELADVPQSRETANDDAAMTKKRPREGSAGEEPVRKRERRLAAAAAEGSEAAEAAGSEAEGSEAEAEGSEAEAEGSEAEEDKKKMGMDVTYDGFSIFGKVLCLVVKKKEARSKQDSSAGQARMETWLASTQQPAEEQLV
jgi:hypothetical protein